MPTIALTCILAVMTPQGQICVKPDGKVEMPAGLEIDKASREFWEEIARVYPFIKNDKYI